jgi:hypothetical protein
MQQSVIVVMAALFDVALRDLMVWTGSLMDAV